MNETTDAPSILAPLWKRKWLILIVGVLVAAGTYEYYNRQAHVFQATTQVFLANGAEEQAQLTAGGGSKRKSGVLNSANQVALINSSAVKQSVRQRLKKERKKGVARVAAHGSVRAAAKEKSEFITISAQARNRRAAALLANVTAQTYIKRQSATYQRQVQDAIALARRQLRRIEAAAEPSPTPQTSSAAKKSANPNSSSTTSTTPAATKGSSGSAATLQAANLSAKINQLESQLFITNIKQIEPAKPGRAELLRPKPKGNAIFGFAIGILLASVAAYALSRFDQRLRSLAEVEAVFGAPILTALPAVRHPIAKRDGLSLPAEALREPLRRLHMTLKVGQANPPGVGTGLPSRVVLFVSADPGDGRSSIVANLAVVQRDAGERVVVVEADFRQPSQARLLGISAAEGLGDVLEGRIAAEDAMLRVGPLQPVVGGQSPQTGAGGVATAFQSRDVGSLAVLLAGGQVRDPAALLARPAMIDLLRSLTEDFHYALLDAPVPLQVSDAIPLLPVVDGIVIVARIGHTSMTAARRLVQLLTSTPSAPILGVVANAVPKAEIKKYGYSPAIGGSRWRRWLTGR